MTVPILVSFRWTNAVGGPSVMTSDTATPAGPGPVAGIHLLAPLSVQWSIDDVLPPVAKPSSASISWYDDGQTTLIDGVATFGPIDIGDPCALYVADGDGANLVTLQGRVADVAGVNHPAGGVVFTAVLVDHLAALASTGAATPLVTIPQIDPFDVFGAVDLYDYYDALAAGEDPALDFDYQDGATHDFPFWLSGQPTLDLANVNLLDALNRFIVQDVRGAVVGSNDPLDYESRWLALDIDEADQDPQAAAYRLQEWDPSLDNLAGILELVLDTGFYRLFVNDDYYPTHDGMVLYADQLLRDTSEWRKTRTAIINRVEADSSSTYGAFSTVSSVRASFADLIAAYGVNSRSVTSDATGTMDATRLATILLGLRDQVQLGYGLSQATMLWQQLTADQRSSLWADILWPAFGRGVGGIYAYPLAIVDVPDTWRLSDGIAVLGRLMGVTWSIDGTDARAQLTIRSVPPTTHAGVTYLGVPPGMTFGNIDPTITFEQLTLVED